MNPLPRLLPIILCLALLATGAVRAHADTLLFDGFEDLDTGAPQVLSPDLSYAPLSSSSGFTFNNLNGNPGYANNSGGWDSASLNTDNYLTFTLTASAAVNWDQVSVDIAANPNAANPGDTGPLHFALRSSADNFGSNLLSSDVTTSYQTLSYNAPTALGNGDSIEYRLYFWGATDSSDQSLVDNLTVTSASVPEPSAGLLGVVAFSCFAGFVLVRRSKVRA